MKRGGTLPVLFNLVHPLVQPLIPVQPLMVVRVCFLRDPVIREQLATSAVASITSSTSALHQSSLQLFTKPGLLWPPISLHLSCG